MDKKIIYKGAEVFYTDEGGGKVLVLVHGFAEDGSLWKPQVNYLAGRFRIIIPDIPGSGRSPMMPGAAGVAPSMEDYADCIRAILDVEKISACTLIGHSMGGYTGLAFIAKYPGYVQGLGLFHSTAYADSEEKKTARRKSIGFINEFGSKPFIRQSLPNLFSEQWRKKNPEKLGELIDYYGNFNPQSLIAYYEAMIARPDRTAVLRAFQNPVLFIIGEEDNVIPLQQSLEQSHMPRLSYIHILKKTAHMGMLEDAEQSNHIIENFLDQAIDET